MSGSGPMDFPRLRLEIESARFQLLRALDDRHEDLKRMIDASLNNAMPEIQAQLNGYVREAVHVALSKLVADAAEQAVAGLKQEVIDRIAAQVTKQVSRRFKA